MNEPHKRSVTCDPDIGGKNTTVIRESGSDMKTALLSTVFFKKTKFWWLLAASLLVSCTTDDRELSITVSPAEVASGSAVTIRAENTSFSDIRDVEVTFEGRSAAIIRIIDSSSVGVLVPKLEPGEAQVALKFQKKFYRTATVTIIPPPLRRVFLAMEGDEITIKRVRPYNGAYDTPAKTGRRLSYDVLDGEGRLLYTCAIPYPDTTEIEVFTRSGGRQPKRLLPPGPTSFVIKIPYVDSLTRVVFFDVDGEVDLGEPEGRRSRTRITEIEIE